MSKKIFSAQDWENVPSEIQQAHTPSIVPIYNKVEDDVESVVREIERRAIDIAPHYKDWVELGFALIFHHIQPSKRFMDGYQPNRFPYIK